MTNYEKAKQDLFLKLDAMNDNELWNKFAIEIKKIFKD